MTRSLFALLVALATSPTSASDLADTDCGSRTISELLSEGWRLEKTDYVTKIGAGGDTISLEDGSIYRADMTSGMLEGEPAVLLSKYVKTEKAVGYIYNLCAGGFDAWVTPSR